MSSVNKKNPRENLNLGAAAVQTISSGPSNSVIGRTRAGLCLGIIKNKLDRVCCASLGELNVVAARLHKHTPQMTRERRGSTWTGHPMIRKTNLESESE